MVSASRNLCRSFLSISRVTPAKRKCLVPIIQCHRQASTSKSNANALPKTFFKDIDENLREAGIDRVSVSPEVEESLRPLFDPQPSEYLVPKQPLTPADLLPEERADYDALPQEQKPDYIARLNHYKAFSETIPEEGDEDYVDEAQVERLEKKLHRTLPFSTHIPKATSAMKGMGMWAEDEADEHGQYPDEDDDFDDSMLSSIAEGELQHHRELRQYTRVVAWEMPLLAKFAKPLQAPTHATPLRFRYTTYMGETHPAARKVVLEFTSRDLATSVKLTEPQRIKLQKLLGPRYNHLNDTAKLSCEKFENAAQNKRYLGDLLGTLIKECKEDKDMFEDVPLDTRHVKEKKKIAFPENWLMTEARVNELAELRQGEVKKVEDGSMSEERRQSQKRIEDFVQKMPLGRRDGQSQQRSDAVEEEMVRVR